MRYAGALATGAAFGVVALVLAVAAGGPSEDGTAADFRTVACAEDPGGLEILRIGLFVAAPLLALAGALVAAARGIRWPLLAGCAEAAVALAAALFVGTLDAPRPPAPRVDSLTVMPASCAPARCSRGLSVRLALDTRSRVVVGARSETGGTPLELSVRGPGGRRAAPDPAGYALGLASGPSRLRVTPRGAPAPGEYLLLIQPRGGESAQVRFTVRTR